MIDTETMVFGKSQHSIIPPGVEATFRMVLGEDIYESPIRNLVERVSGAVMAEHAASPFIRMSHVPIVSGHIEVSGEDQRIAR